MSRMMNGSLAALSLSLALGATGCFGSPYYGPGPGNQVLVGSGDVAPNYGTTPISLIAGGVGNIDPGTAGYIITANAGSFRFTWTGYAEFRGSIFLSGGGFGRLYPGCRDNACALASGEDAVRVGAEPGRIDFVSFPASGKRSGFDVEIPGDTVWIDLLVNDARRPDLTLFAGVRGGQPFQASAATMPLALQIALPQAVALPGADTAKSVVPAPLAAAAWPEPRDPSKVGPQVLSPAGKEDARSVLTDEALLNFRGKEE